MEITKENLKAFRDQFSNLVEALEGEWDVKIVLGNISFSQDSFKTTLTVINSSKDSSLSASDILIRADYERVAAMYQMADIPLMSRFTYKNSIYRIIGAKPRSTKYPIVCEEIGTGKRFKFAADIIKTAQL